MLSRAKCPHCGFVVVAASREANVEAQRTHMWEKHTSLAERLNWPHPSDQVPAPQIAPREES